MGKSRFKTLIQLVLIFLPLLAIFNYKLISSYRYDSDFARDLVDIHQITRGDLRLIGPKLSFGGIHSGPYYYYLLAPVLGIFHKPEYILVANALLFWLSIIVSAFMLIKYSSMKRLPTVLGLYWLATNTYTIFSARNPGNAFSYLPLMLMLLVVGIIRLKKKRFFWLVYGFLWGIVINTHLITMLVMLPLLGLMLYYNIVNSGKDKWQNFLLTIVGVFFSYAPLLLFEVRHNFVMFTNTFVNKSYLSFIENTNLPNPLSSSKNPLVNAVLLIKHFTKWVSLHFGVMLLALIGLLIQKYREVSHQQRTISISAICSFLLLVIVARSQLAIHYFFPFILMVQVGLMLMLVQHRLGVTIFVILIGLNILKFPHDLYSYSPRKIDEFRQVTSEILDNVQVQREIAGSSFNLFVIRETPLAVLGHEYRYFMELAGYPPLSIDEYGQAEKLLVITEPGADEVGDMQSWELSEFGEKQLVYQDKIDDRQIFVFIKK